jgi:hypothetical protein
MLLIDGEETISEIGRRTWQWLERKTSVVSQRFRSGTHECKFEDFFHKRFTWKL